VEVTEIYSWNVNGIRAIQKRGFLDWLNQLPDSALVGLQETRANAEQLTDEILYPPGWWSAFVSAEKKGYSGVGVFARTRPDDVVTELGIDEFDREGRALMVRFGDLDVWSVYFPNGSGTNRDLSRIPYKLRFYKHLLERLSPAISEGRPILVMGDFNTAHKDIDLARPKENVKTSGFRPEEREALDEWIDAGFVDTFRSIHGDVEGQYTWWSQRFGVRERNVGWRIDYILATPAALEFVQGASIHADVMGSDHCPISVSIDNRIFGAEWKPNPLD